MVCFSQPTRAQSANERCALSNIAQAVSLSSEQRVCASLSTLCREQLVALQSATLRAARQPAEALTPHVVTLIQSQTAIWQLTADHVGTMLQTLGQNLDS